MTDSAFAFTPIRESVLAAANGIAEAAPEMALAATRDATAALEFHLDTLAKELRDDIEPRLLERARAVEAKLRAVLVDCWALERDLRDGPVTYLRQREVADKVRDAGDEEIDLVFEELREAGALD